VLSGFRILDLTMGWSGPLATRHLADLGAEVIKVESCTHPDWYRGWDGPFEGDPPPYETKASFAAMNRGKRGITLELTDPRGLVLAQRLAAKSDLLIENYAPGVLDRLGLSAAEAATFAPGIVYVSMGAFGNTGPWREFRAYGSTTEQASGLPFLNGKAEWPPCLQTVAYGDPVAGIYAAAAAVTGLFGQAHAGGAVVDLSQVECLFQLGADGILAATATGRPPARTGSRRTGVVPCGCFPAAGPDAWIALAVETEAQWAALCRLMNQEHLLPLRQAGDEERIDEAVAGWTLQFEAADLAARLQAAGIPAARVTPAHSLREDPHHRQAGYWLELERRHMPRHVVPLAPFRVDGERPSVAGPAPTLGEHNAAVLGEELGVPEAELAGLHLAGVIGSAPRPVK
jgi:crotonobetainyl-CoA:carnitine CoA-transferase CaiB-like acyl-CoA transferase